MKKVFQTVVSGVNGNCQQAAIASLFEKELNEVSDFKADGPSIDFWDGVRNFYEEQGYLLEFFYPKKGYLEITKEALKADGGINGYFVAGVPSQTFPDKMHAVVIDSDMNIVHDPNPNQKALGLGPEDVIHIETANGFWWIDYSDPDAPIIIKEE